MCVCVEMDEVETNVPSDCGRLESPLVPNTICDERGGGIEDMHIDMDNC